MDCLDRRHKVAIPRDKESDIKAVGMCIHKQFSRDAHIRHFLFVNIPGPTATVTDQLVSSVLTKIADNAAICLNGF